MLDFPGFFGSHPIVILNEARALFVHGNLSYTVKT